MILFSIQGCGKSESTKVSSIENSAYSLKELKQVGIYVISTSLQNIQNNNELIIKCDSSIDTASQKISALNKLLKWTNESTENIHFEKQSILKIELEMALEDAILKIQTLSPESKDCPSIDGVLSTSSI